MSVPPHLLHRRRWAAVPLGVVAGLVASAGAVHAQIPNPPADGTAPGAELVTTVLGWLKWAGLAAALAGLLIGAIATGVGHFGSNYSASSAGRKWLLGGMGAAILSGLSWTIATTLYSATGG
ncbi:MAG: hypothetical protein AB7O29_11455 [Acidimicrobiia bacterium]